MIRSATISLNLNKNMFTVGKVAHSTSQPVIYKEYGKYYLAVFVFFYTREDVHTGMISRPLAWVIADMETGEIMEKYQCKDKDFSNASYDVKYNIYPDANYNTFRQYYSGVFAILDSVREKLITTGKLYNLEYQCYLQKILANVPKEYQGFYTDLSV
ncbi:hypothetical protein [uncultured Robinsoniella sp.]|uniref:hypothetical protein n=1 Tax=uncultured Robinsoniella sp. TaxID=904190 RepID=UPI00374F25B7